MTIEDPRTCMQCRNSGEISAPDFSLVLWCEMHNTKTEEVCSLFEREPGTQEREE